MASEKERDNFQNFRGNTGNRERAVTNGLWQTRNQCAVPGQFKGAFSYAGCDRHQFDEPQAPGGQSGAPGLPFLSLGASAVGGLLNPVLTAAQGTYSLSGQAADLDADRRFAAAQGTYALTGQTAGLRAARRAIAAQGSYALSGQSAALRASRAAVAGHGAYSLSGQDAALTYSTPNRALPAGSGTYALSGQDAGLTYAPSARTLTAEAGVYALAGQSATLRGPQAAAQGVGGFVGAWDAWRAEQERLARQRGDDDSENPEQAPSADGAPERPRTPARNAAAPVSASADLQSLRELVARYGREAQEQIDSERAAAALARAVANPTSGALLALDKELSRMREEEEFVVLMALALDD